MLKEKLLGLSVSLIDESIVETFSFVSDHLAATIGTKGGPVCAPILSFEIVGPRSLHIVGQGFRISWDQGEIGPERLSVWRNGIPALYRIDGQPVKCGNGPDSREEPA